MRDGYSIGALWKGRRESAGDAARRFIDSLRHLAAISDIFVRVFEPPRLGRDAFKREIALEPWLLERLLLRGSQGADAQGTGHLGYAATLWTASYPGGDYAEFTVNCGAHSLSSRPQPVNGVSLTLPTGGPIADQLFQVAPLIDVLSCIIAAWQPEWATVNTFPYAQWSQRGRGQPLAGWLTYVSTPSETLPPLPRVDQLLPLGSSGSVIVSSMTKLVASNAQDIALLDRISDALDKAGYLHGAR